MTWFLQFRTKACVGLTPPIRRLPPAQSSGSRRACPRRQHHPWFRQYLIGNDASSEGLLALVFPTLTCPESCPGLCTRRSPPRLFTAAARAGLRPAPESRSRGACPHLLRSCTTRIHFIVYSFRASAAHMLSLYLPSSSYDEVFLDGFTRTHCPRRAEAMRHALALAERP
jgi:hypothetical protein